MSGMKCPFCNKPLQPTHRSENEYWCKNCDCTESSWKFGSMPLWKELIRTRKALDLAKDTLHWYDDNYDSVVARNTLDEITTIEQKEVK